MVYQVVNMLVYFEPAEMCSLPADLVLAPLPAKRHLWEAGDETAWKAQVQNNSSVQNAFGLSTTGELVKLDGDQLYYSDTLLYKSREAGIRSTSSAKWEEWCSGIDGLGGLIMLAASLVG